jgi:anti-sigma B factor antagonist
MAYDLQLEGWNRPGGTELADKGHSRIDLSGQRVAARSKGSRLSCIRSCVPGRACGVVVMVPTPRKNWLEVEQIGDVAVAKFNTRHLLNEDKMHMIGQQLVSLGDEAGYRNLVLSFSAVDRLSTEMLGKILALHRKVQTRGGRLVLCAIKPALFEIFKILRLPQLLTIYADEQEALQKFSG